MSNATVKFAQTKSCEKHFTHVIFYGSYLHINKIIKVEKIKIKCFLFPSVPVFMHCV